MIGGNIKGLLQVKTNDSTNAIGERTPTWKLSNELWGFLDYIGNSTNRNNFHTKLEESTHVFICDYVALDKRPENKRMIIEDLEYDVVFIDDPMNLHQHIEIYLKFTGGQ